LILLIRLLSDYLDQHSLFSSAVEFARRYAPTAMTHIAIQEALDGKVVDWMEHVTDEQYSRCVLSFV